MPDTLRTVGGVTARWDGQGWVPVADVQSSGLADPALARFLGGAASTSMFNPMNVARMVAHPIDTLGSLIGTQVGEGRKAYENFQQGRYSEAAGHGAAALLPVIGPAAAHIGERIGEGDIAGGAGELTGLASNAFIPATMRNTPRAMTAVGRGAEAAGQTLMESRFTPYGALGLLETALRGHPGIATSIAAVPPALKYGGKGLRAVGESLEGLRQAIRPH